MTTILEGPPQVNQFVVFRTRLSRTYQKVLDDSVPHLTARWTVVFFLLLAYILRVYYAGGWYIVSYALGIYMLNLLIGFLSPKIDPSIVEYESGDGLVLPQKRDDEFRPFIRRLPEFKFWYATIRAIVIAITCTFFPALNIPVFWPILLLYFITLFVVTMKNQIKHMIKHRYLPFNIGKKVYQGKKSDK
eukprot:TRINITY_DN1429_c0_g1_i1.p1 TRINITY_DN1429_c0_g1~~TRINITY_DN1429_c0_g1_i1.p1  ORF type:complete len:189 (+),score=26.71 TRINITY_DN1429_c0_g1_i1:180-746(+)